MEPEDYTPFLDYLPPIEQAAESFRRFQETAQEVGVSLVGPFSKAADAMKDAWRRMLIPPGKGFEPEDLDDPVGCLLMADAWEECGNSRMADALRVRADSFRIIKIKIDHEVDFSPLQLPKP